MRIYKESVSGMLKGTGVLGLALLMVRMVDKYRQLANRRIDSYILDIFIL